MAALVTNLYDNARLKNVTGSKKYRFTFYVTEEALEDVKGEASEQYGGQNTYHELLPKVIRSVVFPLCSSLMCSNFVLFPIAERALQVKHLHMITGMSPLLYWLINFVFDFLFYMGTALLVVVPVAVFHHDQLSNNDIELIFTLNCLHGYAALPIVYIFSFLFTNPGNGFSVLAIVTFIISATGCLGAVFMEHYADEASSEWWYPVVQTVLQVSRLVPSNSYSRGMIAILQLAEENLLCETGGAELQSRCYNKLTRHQKSLMRCCQNLESQDPSQYVIRPMDVHPYSAFYEVLTLSLEGVLAFVLLLIIEWKLPRISQYLSKPADRDYNVASEKIFSPTAEALKPVKKMEGDTEVVLEEALVERIMTGGLPLVRVPPLLTVHNLHKAYGEPKYIPVLRGLSFTVSSGECFGLLGVNGVGKTTTFRVLTGELLPHEGDAYISGFSLVRDTAKFRRNIGYCPEKDGLLEMMTGRETLLLFGRLKGIAMTSEYLEAQLDIFHLAEFADHLVGTYSAGNKRKLSLCIAMLGLPKLVLLDEPFVGIGSTARTVILNYMGAFQRASNVSFLMSSHSMPEVESLCNRIGIMGSGRLQCLGSLKKLKQKFGKGYTITIKTVPDRRGDVLYERDLQNAINVIFPDADLVNNYENLLEFRVYQVGVCWSEMFIRMARIKKRFKLQNFFITDASLEQIFLSVTRRQACEAATAAAAAGAAMAPDMGAKLVANTLGI
ncbi:phospholipid-transporting ATPase ABCA3-like [Haemaphysalis longicornis]